MLCELLEIAKACQPRRFARKRESGADEPLACEAIEGLSKVLNEMDLSFAVLPTIDLAVSVAIGGGIDRFDPLPQGLHHGGVEILREGIQFDRVDDGLNPETGSNLLISGTTRSSA